MWNSSVAQILLGMGRPDPDNNQLFGVEVEIEGRNLPARLAGWSVTHDGSLRGEEAREYVFTEPVNLDGSRNRIDNLARRFSPDNAALARIDDSCRAGVHIHFDMRSRTMQQVYTFLIAYYIMEEVLVDMCGEGRQGNLFCLRAKDAEYVIDNLVRAAERENVIELVGDQIRYAAMNTNALGRHGSLEFRAIRTPQDLTTLNWWLTLFDSMLRRTREAFNSPIDVVSIFSMDGPDQLLDMLVPEQAARIKDEVRDYHQKMMNGVRLCQDVAYCNTEWVIPR